LFAYGLISTSNRDLELWHLRFFSIFQKQVHLISDTAANRVEANAQQIRPATVAVDASFGEYSRGAGQSYGASVSARSTTAAGK
jgi:hypothetical protein